MTKPFERINLWGNFGTANWGNECTLQAALHHARTRAPAAAVRCVCSNPTDTTARHEVEAVAIHGARVRGWGLARARAELREWLRVVRAVDAGDLLVMTGTGVVTDSGEGAFGLPYDMFRWCACVRARGGRVAFASVGVEGIRHPLAKWFLFGALTLARHRSYRDQQSRQRLQAAGFERLRDAVAPDLAFSLPSLAAHRAETKPRPTIAVGVYDYRGRGLGSAADAEAYRAYLEKLARLVTCLIARGFDVRVIIGDSTYDEPVLNDLRQVLGELPSDHFEDHPARSVDEVIEHIAGADLVVASRFHNVLLALALGKPVVSISYDAKNDALMAEMGFANACQAIDDFCVDTLCDQVTSLLQRTRETTEANASRVAGYREQLERQYDVLFGSARVRSSAGERLEPGLAREQALGDG